MGEFEDNKKLVKSLMEQKLSVKEIALELGISEWKVITYISKGKVR